MLSVTVLKFIVPLIFNVTVYNALKIMKIIQLFVECFVYGVLPGTKPEGLNLGSVSFCLGIHRQVI